MAGSVRWGIIGTAKIARSSFLPAVHEAGGDPVAVAGRDRDRAEAWARDNGIARPVVGYQALIDDPGVEGDTYEVRAHGKDPVIHSGTAHDEYTFTAVIRHIHAVIRGEESPRELAVDNSLGSARAVEALITSARRGQG